MIRYVGILVAQPRAGGTEQVRTFDPAVGPVHIADFPSTVYRLFATVISIEDDLPPNGEVLPTSEVVWWGARELHSLVDLPAAPAPAAAPAEAAQA